MTAVTKATTADEDQSLCSVVAVKKHRNLLIKRSTFCFGLSSTMIFFMLCSLFLRVICSVSEGGAHQASTTHKVHQLSPLSLPTCQVLLGCLASFCQVLVRLINYSGLCRITASVAT